DLTIKEVKQEKLPELTDEWVKDVSGDPELTVESFKETAHEELLAHSESRLKSFQEKLLIKQLLQQVEIDLPADLVKTAMHERIGRMVNNLQDRGVSDEEIQKQQAVIVNKATAEATQDLKTNFLLREIAQAEALKVTQEE